jgi:hypothetical protein
MYNLSPAQCAGRIGKPQGFGYSVIRVHQWCLIVIIVNFAVINSFFIALRAVQNIADHTKTVFLDYEPPRVFRRPD